MCIDSSCVKTAGEDGVNTCRQGTIGCSCTSAGGCETSDLTCVESGHCVRPVKVFEPGDYGGPCVAGTCRYANLVCFEEAGASICTTRLVSQLSSAVAPLLSLSTILAAIVYRLVA
jgi:hypothetical protein